MSVDDAEARGKRAAELRKQIAELTGGKPRGSDQPARTRPLDEPEPPDGPDAHAGARGAEPGGEVGPGDRSGADRATRRDAPRIHPPSPRDFVERRMREIDRKDDGDHD